MTKATNASEQLQLSSYADIYRAAVNAGVPIAVNPKMWLLIEMVPHLDTLLAQINPQQFGEVSFDCERLSELFSWDAPAGLVVFNVSSQRSLICRPGFYANAALVDSALSWLRRFGADAIGIVLMPQSIAGARAAVLQVFYNPQQIHTRACMNVRNSIRMMLALP